MWFVFNKSKLFLRRLPLAGLFNSIKIFLIFVTLPGSNLLLAQNNSFLISTAVEADNKIFTGDKYWRGADGAATVDLKNGTVLWLFSDTFIDPKGSGNRRGAEMIRNSIAIQKGYNLQNAVLSFHFKGSNENPGSYFEIPGDNWFWTGHGIMLDHKLVIFLMVEMPVDEGLGFQAIGWYAAFIENPYDDPDDWKVDYVQGNETFGVIVGSAAVLNDEKYVYAFGVKEPATHEVFLFRFLIEELAENDISGMEWWAEHSWQNTITELPVSSSLFKGQTEFSVHYDPPRMKYIQVQTFGFGKASIGYRLADQLEGPWSDPVIFYTPALSDGQEFVYSANAHPELLVDGLVITYNVNNFDFGKLVNDDAIYFPRFVLLQFQK